VLERLAPHVRGILVVELSAGQMVEDVRLAIAGAAPVFFHGRTGGMLPSPGDILHELSRIYARTPAVRGEGTSGVAVAACAPDEEADPLGLIEAAEWERFQERCRETDR
jgi:hypothetical protein